MKKHLFFLVILLSMVFSACTTQCPPLTDAQKADIEKEILGLTNKLLNSAEKSDIPNWSDLLSSTEFLGWSLGGTVYQSREIWLDSIGAWWNRWKNLPIKTDYTSNYNFQEV